MQLRNSMYSQLKSAKSNENTSDKVKSSFNELTDNNNLIAKNPFAEQRPP